MINGMWQGQLLDADEVAVTEEFETKIRKAGANHELRCTDPECKCFICYKHGKKRKPHFAHIGESECAYARFEKQDTSDKKRVRSALYTHFTSLGYDVKREIKLPKGRKYCDLLLNINNQNLVLRIALSTTSATYIEEYTKECEQSDCKLLWIAIGDPYDEHFEKHHYHAMRYQFNHTKNKNLLIIDYDATMVSQIKEDNTRYEYKGHLLDYKHSSEDIHNFKIVRPISELRIVDGELTIDSFSDKYNDWMAWKQDAFSQMKTDIDAEEKRIAEAKKLQANQFEGVPKRRVQRQKMKTPRQYNGRNSARFNALSVPNKQIGATFTKISDYSVGRDDSNFARPNTPLIPHKQRGATSTKISDYSVGTRILHSKYGYGQIVEFNEPRSSKHLISIKYDNGQTISCNLDMMINAGTISIIP